MTDLDNALAVLESGAPLPSEPNVRGFVAEWSAWRHPAIGRHRDPEDLISDERFFRLYGAELRRRMNREVCKAVPVPCRRCGAEFYRKQINHLNCPDCVALARSVKREG